VALGFVVARHLAVSALVPVGVWQGREVVVADKSAVPSAMKK